MTKPIPAEGARPEVRQQAQGPPGAALDPFRSSWLTPEEEEQGRSRSLSSFGHGGPGEAPSAEIKGNRAAPHSRASLPRTHSAALVSLVLPGFRRSESAGETSGRAQDHYSQLQITFAYLSTEIEPHPRVSPTKSSKTA